MKRCQVQWSPLKIYGLIYDGYLGYLSSLLQYFRPIPGSEEQWSQEGNSTGNPYGIQQLFPFVVRKKSLQHIKGSAITRGVNWQRLQVHDYHTRNLVPDH